MLKSVAFVSGLFTTMALFAAPPEVADKRLKIELFAEAPQIVTPIGIAVDAKGRVFVVESHTHQRPCRLSRPEGRSHPRV